MSAKVWESGRGNVQLGHLRTCFGRTPRKLPTGPLHNTPVFIVIQLIDHETLSLKASLTGAFSVFAEMFNHHDYLILEHFHHLKRTPMRSHLSPPQTLEATHLFPGSTDLPVLSISYKWNHTRHGFSCLVFFT